MVVDDYILPLKSILLDGFTNVLAARAKWAKGDVSLQSKIERATRRLKTPIPMGGTVSIPSVSWV